MALQFLPASTAASKAAANWSGQTRVAERPRPALFRALGRHEPPAAIEVDDRTFRFVKTFKHDSWAATVLYRADDEWIVCKFNRRQSICGLPMAWLGYWLAWREMKFLEELHDVVNVPIAHGPVRSGGRVLRNAVAHRYIPGRPLQRNAAIGDKFLVELRSTLDELHRRGIAYVDLHKMENVVVGADGQPYLVDFQISQRLPRCWPFSWLQHILIHSDLYHWQKHYVRLRPVPCAHNAVDVTTFMPWWIQLHRLFAVPFRQMRRRLLVLLGIRRGDGSSRTEHEPEEAFRDLPEDSWPVA